jgi:5'-deoxynucleotidase YfbR-like HD superfamily hydrolase
MNLEQYLKGRGPLRNINRFNMEYTIKKQNLCEHGYAVANLFYVLCKDLKVKVTSEDLVLVMNHDFIEAFTGDLNLKVKNFSPETLACWNAIEEEVTPVGLERFTDFGIQNNMTNVKYNLFLLADCFEALLYVKEEIRLGNSALIGAFSYYRLKTLELINQFHFSTDTLKLIESLVREEK